MDFQTGPIDGAAIEPRRRARLEATETKTGARQGRGQAEGRRLPDPAGRDLLLADMDEAAQEGPGGEDHAARRDRPTLGGDDPGYPPGLVDHEILGTPCPERKVRLLRQQCLHRLAIELAIRLGARPADGGAFAAVENTKLDAGAIDGMAHHPIERVDLAHQMALGQATDRRVARHLADGLDAMGEEKGACAKARGRGRSFAAGMPAANDDDIEIAHAGQSRQVALCCKAMVPFLGGQSGEAFA